MDRGTWGCKESDMTEQLSIAQHMKSRITIRPSGAVHSRVCVTKRAGNVFKQKLVPGSS